MSVVYLTIEAIGQWACYASGLDLIDPIDYCTQGNAVMLLSSRANDAFDLWMAV